MRSRTKAEEAEREKPMRDERGPIKLSPNWSHDQRLDYVKRLRAAYLKRGRCCVEIKMIVRFARGGRMESTSVPEPPSMALKAVQRTLAPVLEIEKNKEAHRVRRALQAPPQTTRKRKGKRC